MRTTGGTRNRNGGWVDGHIFTECDRDIRCTGDISFSIGWNRSSLDGFKQFCGVCATLAVNGPAEESELVPADAAKGASASKGLWWTKTMASTVDASAFDAALRCYSWTLRGCLNHRFATFVISVALLAASARLFMVIPKGFLPSEDTGRINVQTEAVQGIGYAELVRHQQQVTDIIAADPNIAGFTSSVVSASNR